MSHTSLKRALATSAAAALTGLALAAGPALADPGQGHGKPGDGKPHPSQGNPNPGEGKPDKPGKPDNPGQGKPDKPGQGNPNPGQGSPNPGQGDPNPGGPKPGQGNPNPGQGSPNPGQGSPNPGQGNPNPGNPNPGQGNPAPGAPQGSPPGNNGSVKIAGLGDLDSIPNNVPHPGCTFQVEWYGFDEGDDVVSTVSFTPHAPTSDVGLTVAGETSVPVGGDAAGGGTDLDGREAYTLTFDGEPHPKQGYHVKLVVSTPRSLGNDTKSKVFWVEPCETSAPADEPGAELEPGVEPQAGQGGSASSQSAEVLGTQADAEDEAEDASTQAAGVDEVAVPTAVDAGDDGSLLGDMGSPMSLMALGLGLLAALALALGLRRNRV
ncbi:hypothetical protein [Nocardioides ferulae]|uniref:hypothetical protein n=1 Tax=Nocardioides ferulae TaxID=2340821 RepID=UPI000EB37AAE|nr:hypothetical protein [Nocardioides ferulae]